jgi:Rieske 2Fe-2S family protein
MSLAPDGLGDLRVPPAPTAHLSRSTPDGSVYRDVRVYRQDLERFFYRSWLCVGREEDLPDEGSFLTQFVGTESILISRNASGEIHAFYNVCRHRGTRVVTARSGRAKTFVCPYHSWTYDVDGRLVGAAHTKEIANFRREENGLFPLRVDRWGGFLFVNFDEEARPFREEFETFVRGHDRYAFERLRLAASRTYEVEANWKIIVENYSECYHCAPVHPSLNRLTPYLTGQNDSYYLGGERRSKFAGGWMEFDKDYTSMTRNGYTKRSPLPGSRPEDLKRVYYHTLFPNLFFSLFPDYLMTHRAWPVSPTHTAIQNEFYFDPAAMASPGFDPSDAVDIWDEINRQDWKVCELAQLGSTSRIWHGGRYADQESLVSDFDQFVEEQRDPPG